MRESVVSAASFNNLVKSIGGLPMRTIFRLPVFWSVEGPLELLTWRTAGGDGRCDLDARITVERLVDRLGNKKHAADWKSNEWLR